MKLILGVILSFLLSNAIAQNAINPQLKIAKPLALPKPVEDVESIQNPRKRHKTRVVNQYEMYLYTRNIFPFYLSVKDDLSVNASELVRQVMESGECPENIESLFNNLSINEKQIVTIFVYGARKPRDDSLFIVSLYTFARCSLQIIDQAFNHFFADSFRLLSMTKEEYKDFAVSRCLLNEAIAYKYFKFGDPGDTIIDFIDSMTHMIWMASPSEGIPMGLMGFMNWKR